MPEKGKVKIFEDYKKKRSDRRERSVKPFGAAKQPNFDNTFKQSKNSLAEPKEPTRPNREIDSPTTFRDDSPLMKMASGSPLLNFPGKAAWTADQQSKAVNKRSKLSYEEAKRAYIRNKSEKSRQNRIVETGNSSAEETFTKAASA